MLVRERRQVGTVCDVDQRAPLFSPLGAPCNKPPWGVLTAVDLNAGEIVSTGTCTGIVYIEKGQKAVADYGMLGAIEVTFD